MSKKKGNPDGNPVPEKLCLSRMSGQEKYFDEKIDGIKRTIYASSAAMTTVIVLIQLALTLFG